MKALTLVAVSAVLAGTARAQTPAPQPTPVPCWGMAGLEIGQSRAIAFQRMARLDKPKSTVTNDLKVLHSPVGRPWRVEVTFNSPADEAKVVLLHYVVTPPKNLLEGLLERYGKATVAPADPSSTFWNDPRCGLVIRYKTVLSETGQPAQEEVWVEPQGSRPGRKSP
jgi:hypothetical protein